eukprot:4954844-Pyramimonas_sp.AAC.1
MGAKGQIFEVTGMSNPEFKQYPSLLRDNEKHGVAFWGSPRWGTAANDLETATFKSSSVFKTNAFESMSWQSGSALTTLTFPKFYNIELWNPCYPDPKGRPDTRDPRMLICLSAHFREYRPLASGTKFQE